MWVSVFQLLAVFFSVNASQKGLHCAVQIHTYRATAPPVARKLMRRTNSQFRHSCISMFLFFSFFFFSLSVQRFRYHLLCSGIDSIAPERFLFAEALSQTHNHQQSTAFKSNDQFAWLTSINSVKRCVSLALCSVYKKEIGEISSCHLSLQPFIQLIYNRIVWFDFSLCV